MIVVIYESIYCIITTFPWKIYLKREGPTIVYSHQIKQKKRIRLITNLFSICAGNGEETLKEKEIREITEKCYDAHFADPNKDYNSIEFYYAVSQTVE